MVARDTGEPLPHALVQIVGTAQRAETGIAAAARRAETGADGSFVLRDVPPGLWRVGVTLVGYVPGIDSLAVAPRDSLSTGADDRVFTLRFALQPIAFPLSEIVVRAAPTEDAAHAQSLSGERLRGIPASGGDLFRAIQPLPGLAAPDVSASFLIRGGESDETLVRVDGIDLLEPFHVRDWGGALSVVSVEAVESARLQRGGLPARYGRQLSGALEIELPRRPSRTSVQLGAGITHARALLGGAFGESGSDLLGVRHGLMAATYRTFQFVSDTRIEPDFQDVIAKVGLKTGPRQELTLLAVGARDDLLYDESFDESDIHGTQRHLTLGARWSVALASRMRYRAVISSDLFERTRRVGRTGHDDIRTRAARARFEGEASLGAAQTLEAGLGLEWEDTKGQIESISASFFGGDYRESVDLHAGGAAVRRRIETHASLHSRWGARFTTTAGVNLARDAYSWGIRVNGAVPRTESGNWLLAPRLATSARLGPRVTARAALGVLGQPTFLNNLNEDRALLPLGRRRQAREALLGVAVTPARFTVRIEGYARSERGVSFPVQDLSIHPVLQVPLDRGRSRGVELFAQTPPWRRLDAWLGYALSRATWSTPTGDVPRSFDQTHALSGSVSVRPLGRWSANATAKYHTGAPYTKRTWVSPDGHYDWDYFFGPLMGSRFPDYFRLDLRLSTPLPIGSPGSLAYVELINATGHENVYLYTYEFNTHPDGYGRQPRWKVIQQFPRLPSVGIELHF